MPDAYTASLDIEYTVLPFEQLVEILHAVIARRPLDRVSIQTLSTRTGQRHCYQLGVNGKGPVLELWPTKAGGAVLGVSGETVDSITKGIGKGDSLLRGLLTMRKISRLNEHLASFPGLCTAYRSALLAADPSARVFLRQE